MPRRINSIKYIITILSLFLLFNSCIEEKVDPILLGSIQGKVLSKSTNKPIVDVEISTAPVTSVAFTNADGEFHVDNVPEGEYTILTQINEYSRQSIKIKVIRNSTTEIIIKLVTSNILAPTPIAPTPADGQHNLPLSLSLKWSVNDLISDSLEYKVTIYEANNMVPFVEAKHLRDTSLLVENLKYNTTYFWQVDAISSSGYQTASKLWLFKTIPLPDNRFVFSSRINGNHEIYSSNKNGDSLLRITNSYGNKLKPLFDSKRNLIAFSSNYTLDYHIYIMNKDGSGIHRITTLPIAGYHNQGIGFSWSPDYGKFIYSYYNKLFRIDRDGVNLILLSMAPANRNFRSCDWTAVGNKIIVETVGPSIYDSEIYLMNADGTDTLRLVDNLPGIIESPSFSIDGKEIIFTRDASGFESEDGRQLDANIYIMNIETKQVIEVSGNKTEGSNDLQPRFSPDGSQIIFTNAPNDGTGVKSIWIMDKNGANRQKLFDNAEMPDWQ